jgi:Kef-type K+ transport system membrane component KefB
MSTFEVSVHFFLQLVIILGACQIMGMLAKYIGQPRVVGEMIAGVVIGPSLLGLLAPEAQAFLFPKESMSILFAVSQVGLVLYMFLIGTEFKVDLIQQRTKNAIAVSAAGIILPFALGGGLAFFMSSNTTFFAPTITTIDAILFLGAAMAITAFPMLARIIDERGLTGTPLGTLVLAAGSIDDAAAWGVLAIVLSRINGDAAVAVRAIGGGVLYAVGVLLLARPLFRQLGRIAQRSGGVNGTILTFIMMIVMLGAWFTDSIGIYAVFGAFVLGVAMPRGIVTEELQAKIGPLATYVLLPLFFTYSGLNTRIGLVDSPFLWGVVLLIILTATCGKALGCWIAARWSGETQRDSLAIGALMNARGLMELIILNIGLQQGIITPTLFTMMVLMAIVTTLMASPLFVLVHQVRATAPLPRPSGATE